MDNKKHQSTSNHGAINRLEKSTNPCFASNIFGCCQPAEFGETDREKLGLSSIESLHSINNK